jgi:hypothetical protein
VFVASSSLTLISHACMFRYIDHHPIMAESKLDRSLDDIIKSTGGDRSERKGGSEAGTKPFCSFSCPLHIRDHVAMVWYGM